LFESFVHVRSLQKEASVIDYYRWITINIEVDVMIIPLEEMFLQTLTGGIDNTRFFQ
jgi:hypothetical protein